jgi:threonine aldolase
LFFFLLWLLILHGMSNFPQRGFASDNNSGVHSAFLEAIADANEGHAMAYGDDPFTLNATRLIREHFGDTAEVYFVLTGTAANVLGLCALTNSFHGIICAETAHINTDECGAPEKFTQCKLLSVNTPDGKLMPDEIKKHLHDFGFEHHVQPRVISISQPTEMGTVYTVDEIKALSDLAHKNNLFLHMDGARLANAAVSLNLPFRAFTVDAGVDVLSFGGTKNGMLFGESVIFFHPELAVDFKYRRKQGMQLVSKMRFIAVQFIVYLEKGIWQINAAHANKMAMLLYSKAKKIPEIQITQKVESNALFAIIPRSVIQPLQEKYFFYVWNESRNEVRWMTSYDTTEEDIDLFSESLKSIIC